MRGDTLIIQRPLTMSKDEKTELRKADRTVRTVGANCFIFSNISSGSSGNVKP